MRIFKTILRNLHRYVFWALISFVLWAWIFTLITDAPKEKKLTVCVSLDTVSVREFSYELEKTKPEGIRLIRVRSSNEETVKPENALRSDVYIVPESVISAIADKLAPLSGFDEEGGFFYDGKLVGVCVCDPERNLYIASRFIDYPENGNEKYYLCISASSVHSGLEGAKDAAGPELARMILDLGTEG
jgi:hypothetical protein